jgi:hypothetical protein
MSPNEGATGNGTTRAIESSKTTVTCGRAMRIPFSWGAGLAVCLAGSLVFAIVAIPQNAPVNASTTDDESKIAGTWRGDSVCVAKGTSCHDEIAVYRIAAIPGKRGYLSVTAGKVVDGKEIVMGSGEWRYDSGMHTLTVELPSGVITLKIDGDKIEGTFILADKTVLRRITLKKSD